MKKIIIFFLFISLFTSLKAQEYWHRVACGLGEVGTGESVNALLYDSIDNKLYAVGTFLTIDDTLACPGIAKWDGQEWDSIIPSGGIPSFTSLLLYNGYLWVGTANGYVGYYNGTAVVNVGGFNDEVLTMCVYRNKLYVGGRFTDVDGMSVSFIACYDGTNWSEPGGGIWCTQFPGDVSAMCVWNDKLIVGGSFDQAGGVSVHSVAAWNDTAWSDVGGGVIYTNAPTLVAMVFSLGVYQNDLIVGGRLDKTGDNTMVNYICEFNGVNWSSLGIGTTADVEAVYGWDSILYVGGGFLSAGGMPNTHYIAKWNGAQWQNVGTGLEGNPKTFCVYDSILYVGGYGFAIDGFIAPGIVRLMNYPDTALAINEIKETEFTIYPNPANETVTITAENIKEIVVSNLLGEVVQSLKYKVQSNTAAIDISKLSQGIYLLRFQTNNGWRVGKVVKE